MSDRKIGEPSDEVNGARGENGPRKACVRQGNGRRTGRPLLGEWEKDRKAAPRGMVEGQEGRS